MYEGLRTDAPTPAMQAAILRTATEMYKSARWRLPEDFLQESHFRRVVRTRLDWTSSPGYPYLLRSTNNGQLFKFSPETGPDEEVLHHIWSQVQDRLEGRLPADPIRLFIKAEAHSKKKLESEKYRLISSVSVVDQIIDHMLFADANDASLANYMDIPSKAGWSCFGGGWRHIPEEEWMATDASAWDWTERLWLIDLTLKLKQALCDNATEQWLQLSAWRYKELYVAPVFVTSGGMLLKQKNPGVQKSGCVNTIRDNSDAGALLHIRVCLELGLPVTPIMKMGDDTLQEKPRLLKEYLELLGQYCVLKSVTMKNEFAGFLFRGRRVEPVHRGKHVGE